VIKGEIFDTLKMTFTLNENQLGTTYYYPVPIFEQQQCESDFILRMVQTVGVVVLRKAAD